MTEPQARRAFASGTDPATVARALADQLSHPGLKIVFLFSSCRLDPATLVAGLRGLEAPVVGCTALGVVGARKPSGGDPAAYALGLYGDWLRIGVGIAPDLSKAALTRGRDAVRQAAETLGYTADTLDPGRHIAVTLVDGRFNHEEAFCIGSAAAAPQIRFIGGGASSQLEREPRTSVFANNAVHTDAAVVVILDSDQPFHAVTSSHLEPTALKTVVTAASGRVIDELDGRPAGARLAYLLASIGDTVDEERPQHSFARYIDGVPYVRSLHRVAGNRLIVASAVETGQILHVMRPGDLIGIMTRDLAAAAERVGGAMAAFLAFSCIGRHWEASQRGRGREMAATFAAYPTVGFQSLSEQSGMLLVNHTLTGLAIGAHKP